MESSFFAHSQKGLQLLFDVPQQRPLQVITAMKLSATLNFVLKTLTLLNLVFNLVLCSRKLQLVLVLTVLELIHVNLI